MDTSIDYASKKLADINSGRQKIEDERTYNMKDKRKSLLRKMRIYK